MIAHTSQGHSIRYHSSLCPLCQWLLFIIQTWTFRPYSSPPGVGSTTMASRQSFSPSRYCQALPLPTNLLLWLPLHPYLTPSSPEDLGFYHKSQEALGGYFCGVCANLYQEWGEYDRLCIWWGRQRGNGREESSPLYVGMLLSLSIGLTCSSSRRWCGGSRAPQVSFFHTGKSWDSASETIGIYQADWKP